MKYESMSFIEMEIVLNTVLERYYFSIPFM